MPEYPDCWETCGNCGNGDVSVQSLLVKPGDFLRADETILVLETSKVALDIPSPISGSVVAVLVEEGQSVQAGQLLITLATT